MGRRLTLLSRLTHAQPRRLLDKYFELLLSLMSDAFVPRPPHLMSAAYSVILDQHGMNEAFMRLVCDFVALVQLCSHQVGNWQKYDIFADPRFFSDLMAMNE